MSDHKSPQLSLPILARVQLTFANFVSGDENLPLVTSLLDLVAPHKLSNTASSVYFAGPEGSGKTHLLFAVLNSLSQDSGRADCQYLDCTKIRGRSGLMHDFSPKKVTLLDNVDSLRGSRDDETALFGLVERIRQANSVFVATGSQTVDETSWNLADVASRLSAGLIFALKELDDDGTRDALRLRFQAAGLVVSDRVLDYILTHFSRDKHSLFGAIDDLDQSALREQRKITIPFLKEFLKVD